MCLCRPVGLCLISARKRAVSSASVHGSVRREACFSALVVGEWASALGAGEGMEEVVSGFVEGGEEAVVARVRLRGGMVGWTEGWSRCG